MKAHHLHTPRHIAWPSATSFSSSPASLHPWPPAFYASIFRSINHRSIPVIMPKDKSSRALASRKEKKYVYQPYLAHGKGLEITEQDTSNDPAAGKDWVDATCPICMDTPHNAVLLLCSSRKKGCHPYICDTSYRHSNCLDQYQKAHFGAQKTHGHTEQSSRSSWLDTAEGSMLQRSEAIGSDSVRRNRRSGRNGPIPHLNVAEEFEEVQFREFEDVSVDEGGGMKDPAISEHSRGSSCLVKGHLKDLVCPLCRGKVNGWQVVDEARQYLNQKARSCAQESCLFVGNYEDLRIHARREHPFARPSAIDPAREQDWRRMERERDIGDVFSTIRSAMPGATVIGDIAIEDDLENDEMDFPGDDGHWWTVFMLFQFFGGPATSFVSGRGASSHSRAHSHGLRRNGRARLGLSWHRNGTDASNEPFDASTTEEQASESSQQQHRSSHRSPGA